MSLHDDIQFIKDASYAELTASHLRLVFDTYYKVFGEVCTGCPAKIAGYIKKLKNYDIMAKKAQKPNFILKQGALIVFRGESKAYSNANLTDEVAVRFLKGNENRQALFSKLPKNLDELLKVENQDNGSSDEATAVVISNKEYTVDQAVELLNKVGVNTKAKTVEGVQKRVDELTDEQLKNLDELLVEESDVVTDAAKRAEAEEVEENGKTKKSDEEE